jgi:uncharacterized delta-60 repeat protein
VRRRVRRVSDLLGVSVAAVLVAALLAASAQAEPGDLDSSFGLGGKVVTDFGPGSNLAAAVVVQADGKIVAAGTGGSGHFALARYNGDGSLDLSFGAGGKVTTVVGGIFESANAVALQADGKIVAAGGSSPDGFCCQVALARYNPDGSLDASFDGDGKLTTVVGGAATANAVAVQADGKIVIAGSFVFGNVFVVARFNGDGSLDTTFGTNGEVFTGFGGFGNRATSLVIQADGKILVAGAGGAGNDFILARYNSDGTLDGGFGSGGSIATDFGGFDGANAVALQSDGKIVAAGIGTERFALARYSADGSLDQSFGVGGKTTVQFFGENIESANALAIQRNGKIVAAGRAFSDFDPSYAIARFNTDGTLDASFGSGGKVTTDFGNPSDVGVLCPSGRKDCSNDNATGVAIQADGNIVAVGGGGACTPSCEWTLARYLGDPTVTEVTMDVKPGSAINPINLSANGVIPVAILSTGSFDATTVDPSTVCFGDSDHPDQRDCTAVSGGHITDVNGDGRLDLMLQYEIAQTGIDPGDTTACLTGTTFGGVSVEGCDLIATF